MFLQDILWQFILLTYLLRLNSACSSRSIGRQEVLRRFCSGVFSRVGLLAQCPTLLFSQHELGTGYGRVKVYFNIQVYVYVLELTYKCVSSNVVSAHYEKVGIFNFKKKYYITSIAPYKIHFNIYKCI